MAASKGPAIPARSVRRRSVPCRQVEGSSVEKARILFPEIFPGPFRVDIEAQTRRFQ